MKRAAIMNRETTAMIVFYDMLLLYRYYKNRANKNVMINSEM